METTNKYIPALRFHWLTPLYDQLVRRFMREDLIRGRLVWLADIQPGMRVLDLGCGTGTLTILIKQSHVMSQVFGLDIDPQILNIATSKARENNVAISLEQGLAYHLSFPNAWFDRIVSSLVFHHLTGQQKQQAFNEVYRVLQPGGRLYLLDFGMPHSAYGRLVSLVLRHNEQVLDNIRGILPGMMRDAGFVNVSEIECFETLFGSLSLFRADKL